MEEVHLVDFEGGVAGKGVGVCELENLNFVRTFFTTIIECSTFCLQNHYYMQICTDRPFKPSNQESRFL